MFLIVSGCIVPIVVLVSVLRMSVSRYGELGPRRSVIDLRPWTMSRWEGLADEMTRHGHRVRPRSSDAATRRRHLAAVLPADARR